MISIIRQNGAFGTKDEPALTPYNHPKPIACISGLVWWLHPIDMSQSTTTYAHPYSHTESVSALRGPGARSIHPPCPSTWEPPTILSAQFCLPQNVIQAGNIPYGAFSDWLRSLGNVHLSFLLVSHGRIPQFFLELDDPLLSGCTSFTLLPAEGLLGCFQVWAIMDRSTVDTLVQFWCGRSSGRLQ